MSASPFAFLRGSALLFDECLRREGSWAKGPGGGGSLVGDLHLENFGVFIADGGAAIFNVNDFDALRDGPWRFDVLRLLTSVLLGRFELKASGTQVQELARMALEGHQLGLSGERVAVFRYGGKVSAVSNVCQHQNGPLGEGKIVNGCITCPWHGYQYLPDTGASPPPFVEKIPTFEVRLRGGRVLIHPTPRPAGTRCNPALISPAIV